MRKKYPYQKGIPTKYMPNMTDEPMSGPASKVDKAPEGQKRAYQLDLLTDLEAIEKRLLNNYFRLNRDTMAVEVLATPEWPEGVDTDVHQLVARDKSPNCSFWISGLNCFTLGRTATNGLSRLDTPPSVILTTVGLFRLPLLSPFYYLL